MGKAVCFSETLKFNRVDRAGGVICGVSVITEGPALGHDLVVDHTTLQQLLSASKSFSNGVKVKAEHSGGVTEILGAVKNFRIEGAKLIGDLHLLESAELRDYVLELAEKLPDTFGLSVSFFGEPDGNAARCDRIRSVDLVADPAANPDGLFSEGQEVDMGVSGKMDQHPQPNSPTHVVNVHHAHPGEPKSDDVNGKLDELNARIEAIENLIRAAVEAEQKEQMAEEGEQSPEAPEGEESEAPEGEESEHPKRKKPDQGETDLSALRAAVTELSSKNDALVELVRNLGGTAIPRGVSSGKPAAKSFSQVVESLMAEGLTKTAATRQAIEKHTDLYRAELAAQGVISL